MRQKKVDGSVVGKLVKMQPTEVPEHLKKDKWARRKSDFDPNDYFTVLTHLSMKPGYTLDYAYLYFKRFAGEPLLYARPVGSRPFRSPGKYWEWRDRQLAEEWEKWISDDPVFADGKSDLTEEEERHKEDMKEAFLEKETKNILPRFMVLDGTPDSFFQLVVFTRLAGQFYLYWHAFYKNIKIVTSRDEMESLIDEITTKGHGAKLTDRQKADLRAIDPDPQVKISRDTAAVTYCMFSKWGGLWQFTEKFSVTPPYRCAGTRQLAWVFYDCKLSF
ncbi:MAG: hypothetical protein ACOZBW_08035 [Thermodesulfobacteriota bacterium]